MEQQRGHLERNKGDVERGVADVLVDEKIVIHSTPHLQPQWLLNWVRGALLLNFPMRSDLP